MCCTAHAVKQRPHRPTSAGAADAVSLSAVSLAEATEAYAAAHLPSCPRAMHSGNGTAVTAHVSRSTREAVHSADSPTRRHSLASAAKQRTLCGHIRKVVARVLVSAL